MEGGSEAYALRNSTTLEGEPMYGLLTASASLGSTLPIVECGNSTTTVAETSSGITVSGVISSDRTAISSIESKVNAEKM
jgi:hypothetical protein